MASQAGGILCPCTNGGYLIASRSPPSHDPKLLSFFRICPLPGTHFCQFGLTFGVTFASLGPLLEHFGYIFRAKKRPEAPEVPPEVPKGDFLEKCNFLGPHLAAFSEDLLFFLMKSLCFFHGVFKALFLFSVLYVFEQMGTVKTIKNIAQGSKNSVCIKSKKLVRGQV